MTGGGGGSTLLRRRLLALQRPTVTILVWLLGAAWFFREQWRTGFKIVMGNGGDTALIVYLLEHWFTVLHGRSSWTSPDFFWPVKGVLGWSDGLVLLEVFYVPLRFAGADPFLAAQLTVVALSLVGFLSFVALVQAIFVPPRWLALAGGLVFTFANDLYANAGRFQLLGVWLVPLVALTLLWALRSATTARAVVLGLLSGLLEGLLFFTSYYIAWLCLPGLLLGAAAALVLSPRRLLAAGRRWIVERYPVWISTAIGFGLAMIPFLDAYLPAQRQLPRPGYQAILRVYGDRVHDLIAMGTGNLLWGAPDRSESYAATPVLMVAAVILSVAAGLLSRRRLGQVSPGALAAGAAAFSAVALSILPVHFGHWSLWILIWHLPGGDAMRAISRVGIIASVAATTAVVAAGGEIWASLPRRKGIAPRLGLAALAAVVVAEQINTADVSGIRRPAETAFLQSVPSAPRGCRSFYATDGPHPTMAWFVFQVDAMFAAQKLGLPTLNGYTGYNPAGWTLEVPGPRYGAEVQQWITAHRLSDVCALDFATMTWTSAMR